ncbi:hypothetical protein [Belnapia moabensis]|uniref:hypothetical protein n=1 Tax=Belnapia moabensis TaxID=365533 RepID=UPI00146FE1FC|nr:hypothetical protein [Belnapia moabensis]
MSKKVVPPIETTSLAAPRAKPVSSADTLPIKKPAKPAKPATKKRTEPLNFRVASDFRRAFKRAAAAQDCKKVELLERIFAEWSARNPT